MANYPTEIPNIIEAGVTVAFALVAKDLTGTELNYTDDGFTMAAIFNNADNSYSATSIVDTDQGYLITIPSSASSAWTPGDYNCTVYVDDGTDRYNVTQKFMEIKPNLYSGAVDSRSNTRQLIDAIDASLLGSATNNQMSMSIAGRAISRYQPSELISLRKYYEAKLVDEDKAQRLADGKPLQNYLRTRFI